MWPGSWIEQLRGGAIALVGALALACGGPVEPIDASALKEKQSAVPPALLEKVVFEGYMAGNREVEVRARAAKVDAVGRTVELREVRISLDDEQRGTVQIQAASAQLDLDADDFLLRDRVEGTTGRGEHFITAEVRYEQDAERLFTDRPVVVHRPDLTLTGDGMELDLKTRTLKISGNVRTQVKPR